MTLVTICLCTCRRPQLVETLDSLEQQVLPPGVTMEYSIVDNDAAASAKATVAEFARRTPRTVRYQVVEEKSISLARNASVGPARGEWLVFIDDDEHAEPRWLATLLSCAEQYRADVVLGAVETRYPAETPDWIRRGGFFDKSLPPTGSEMHLGSTCNALVRRDALPDPVAPFAPRFGITGGGDTDFFNRIHRQGGKIVTCREALVWETVETNRLNQEYLIRRATRVGENYALIFFRRLPWIGRVAQCSRALVQAAASGLTAVVFTPFGRHQSFPYVLKMRTNWGKVRFFLNRPRVEIYK